MSQPFAEDPAAWKQQYGFQPQQPGAPAPAYAGPFDAAYQAKLAYKHQKLEAKKVKKLAKQDVKASKKLQKYAGVPLSGSDEASRGSMDGSAPVPGAYDPNMVATATAYQQYQMSKVDIKKQKIASKVEQKQYAKQQKYAEKASKKAFKQQQKSGMMAPAPHYSSGGAIPGAVPFGAPQTGLDHPVSM
eukprot:CAMPEP_0177645272 /NCGR_PEP_ID=MMETSP0447-20121125/9161_1 /TAXON_ID=0 /ORGANISM="Stygamoeba regulata, Strain BSH-02190019" /LENGTH=187 /DNA_ID=CAMNT_0019147745 /DNA_START=125 /DNA_END=688 /DNA_ORIENTATION=-